MHVMPDISLIIPFLNEAENLPDLVHQLNDYAVSCDFSIEAVLVDDGSTDESIKVLRNIVSSVPIKLVCLSKNFGSHAAVRAGITQTTGSYTMFFSADLQEPFSMIGEMYERAREGYDVVIARKSTVQISWMERVFSSLSTSLFRKFAMPDFPKGGANNFLFSTKVRERILENVENNSSIHMQLISMGYRRSSIDVVLNKRYKGKSKWTFSKRVKLFIDSFVAFSYMPIRMISILGIVMFLAGVIYAVWIVIASLTGLVEFDAGFPTLISVLLLGFGMTNFALGIVAEYIWRTLDAARNRPVFIIDTIEILSGKN
jgi:dolichol-phosphate mannosyltransferase